MATYPVTVTENIKVRGFVPSFTVAREIELGELMIVTGRLSRLYRAVATIRHTLSLTHTAGMGALHRIALASVLSLGGRLRAGTGAYLFSGFTLRSKLTTAQAIRLRDSLWLAARISITHFYTQILRESLRLSSGAPTVQLGLYLQNHLRLAANVTKTYRAVATMGDHLRLSDALARKLVVVVVSRDTIALTAAEILRGIYTATLRDTVDFFIDTISPSGDVTTWAMNVRTGAVTEYTGFDFNSFALSAAGTYLGANDDGLYELIGPDDAGTPVIADLISGLVDFGNSYFSGIKAAYLGVSSAGEYYLKLTSGDGKSTVYRAQGDSLRSSRINMGKGLRSKYFTWELTSVGQDFSLNDLTFLPLQATRRV